MTEVQIPSKLAFNEQMVSGPAEPQYVEDLYMGVITQLKQKLCPFDKSGDLGIELTLRATDASQRPAGPSVRYWIGIPVANPNIPGHFVSRELVDDKFKAGFKTSKYEKMLKRNRDLVIAVGKGDSIPPYPKKKEGTTGVYVDPATGETMTQEDMKVRRKVIERAVLSQLLDWFNQAGDDVADSDKELLNAVLFFQTGTSDSGYARVSYVTNNIKGVEHRTSEFTGSPAVSD